MDSWIHKNHFIFVFLYVYLEKSTLNLKKKTETPLGFFLYIDVHKI